MSPAFVVIWRPDPQTAWHVQPHVHDGSNAAKVGGHLVNRFGGEAWAVPIELPTAEDSRD